MVDLDSLPLHYKVLSTLGTDLTRTQLAFLETTRGCPYSCSFCDQALRRVRMRDICLVKQDLSYIYHHGARRIILL